MSADSALRLEALTLWDAEIWLLLQAKWDLWHAAQARGPRPKVRCREARSREERMAFRRALRCRGHQPVANSVPNTQPALPHDTPQFPPIEPRHQNR